jgi:hypothetical protein
VPAQLQPLEILKQIGLRVFGIFSFILASVRRKFMSVNPRLHLWLVIWGLGESGLQASS